MDGDTLWAVIDLGFGVGSRQKLRLRGIDTPERGTKDGRKAKKYVEEALAGTREEARQKALDRGAEDRAVETGNRIKGENEKENRAQGLWDRALEIRAQDGSGPRTQGIRTQEAGEGNRAQEEGDRQGKKGDRTQGVGRKGEGARIVIRTHSTDKYDRYLADIFYLPGEGEPQAVAEKGVFLNQELLDEGLARVMT